MVRALDHGDGMSNADPMTISSRLWSYIFLALTDSSEMTNFNRVVRLNGFDARRTLIAPLKPKSDARRLELHSSVHVPGRAPSY